MHVEHEELIFSLSGDWRGVPSEDREQLFFESVEHEASIVFSVMRDLAIPIEKLESSARFFAKARCDAEISARAPGTVRFQEPWVGLKSDKEIAEIAYSGNDDTGLTFRFYGLITRRKVVSIWLANLYSLAVSDLPSPRPSPPRGERERGRGRVRRPSAWA